MEASTRPLWPALVLVLSLLMPTVATAQGVGQNSLFSAAPTSGMLTPAPAAPRGGFSPGGVMAPQPHTEWPPNAPRVTTPTVPMVRAGQAALALSARFGKAGPEITGGLIWRVYAAKPDATGNFRLVKEDKSPSPTLVLPTGNYIVHVGFGLATAVKPVTLNGPTVYEAFDLPAGGLRLEGRVGDVRIPAGQVSFDVYRGSPAEKGGLAAGDVLLQVGATRILNLQDLSVALRSHRPGDLVEVTFQRGGGTRTVKVTLEERR